MTTQQTSWWRVDKEMDESLLVPHGDAGLDAARVFLAWSQATGHFIKLDAQTGIPSVGSVKRAVDQAYQVHGPTLVQSLGAATGDFSSAKSVLDGWCKQTIESNTWLFKILRSKGLPARTCAEMVADVSGLKSHQLRNYLPHASNGISPKQRAAADECLFGCLSAVEIQTKGLVSKATTTLDRPVQFKESEHPRDQLGRFTEVSAAPSLADTLKQMTAPAKAAKKQKKKASKKARKEAEAAKATKDAKRAKVLRLSSMSRQGTPKVSTKTSVQATTAVTAKPAPVSTKMMATAKVTMPAPVKAPVTSYTPSEPSVSTYLPEMESMVVYMEPNRTGLLLDTDMHGDPVTVPLHSILGVNPLTQEQSYWASKPMVGDTFQAYDERDTIASRIVDNHEMSHGAGSVQLNEYTQANEEIVDWFISNGYVYETTPGHYRLRGADTRAGFEDMVKAIYLQDLVSALNHYYETDYDTGDFQVEVDYSSSHETAKSNPIDDVISVTFRIPGQKIYLPVIHELHFQHNVPARLEREEGLDPESAVHPEEQYTLQPDLMSRYRINPTQKDTLHRLTTGDSIVRHDIDSPPFVIKRIYMHNMDDRIDPIGKAVGVLERPTEFKEELHPRDDLGRFTAVGTEVGRETSPSLESIADLMAAGERTKAKAERRAKLARLSSLSQKTKPVQVAATGPQVKASIRTSARPAAVQVKVAPQAQPSVRAIAEQTLAVPKAGTDASSLTGSFENDQKYQVTSVNPTDYFTIDPSGMVALESLYPRGNPRSVIYSPFSNLEQPIATDDIYAFVSEEAANWAVSETENSQPTMSMRLGSNPADQILAANAMDTKVKIEQGRETGLTVAEPHLYYVTHDGGTLNRADASEIRDFVVVLTPKDKIYPSSMPLRYIRTTTTAALLSNIKDDQRAISSSLVNLRIHVYAPATKEHR